MNKEFINHGIKFNNGDRVKQKSTDIIMVVIETEDGYGAPYSERVICKYWHPTKQEFTQEQFIPTELELVTE